MYKLLPEATTDYVPNFHWHVIGKTPGLFTWDIVFSSILLPLTDDSQLADPFAYFANKRYFDEKFCLLSLWW